MKLHNIKDILEERRIEVPKNSWEQLATQLDANDQNKKRRKLYPYAACLALLVGLITLMVSKSVGESQVQSVVETEAIKVQEEIETPKSTILKEEINDELFNAAIAVHKDLFYLKQSEIVEKSPKKEALIPNKQREIVIKLQKEIENTVVVQENENLPKEIEAIITQKDVVVDTNKDLKASIAALSVAENSTITDAEINQMLKEAQQSLSELEITKEKDTMRFATADELLNEVEYELDRSFKQRVFDLIKKNVKKGKTLLADRN
ncbi:hypothetical protein [Kordia sp.]|uniref:hypothetical protein n=1 Tax=Kordia sp. TaxID=1965332 RepID=UPI003D2E37F7